MRSNIRHCLLRDQGHESVESTTESASYAADWFRANHWRPEVMRWPTFGRRPADGRDRMVRTLILPVFSEAADILSDRGLNVRDKVPLAHRHMRVVNTVVTEW